MSTYLASHNIISPLGFSTNENFQNIEKGKSAIGLQKNPLLSSTPFYGSVMDSGKLNAEFDNIGNSDSYTRFERMLLLSVSKALRESNVDVKSDRTLLLISTTKGNIDLLEKHKGQRFTEDRVLLWEAARQVQEFFGNPNKAIVLSNACISGTLAIIMAADMINAGHYDHVIVSGADIISKFVVAGFQSFMALDEQSCKPYDKARNGLNLGEGCGTIILTNDSSARVDGQKIVVAGGSSTNDANHISGPSRTGEGLSSAISRALGYAGISAKEVGYLSAHGTATIFNDEMESLAFANSGLSEIPVNSLKGYFGHTLGAAGTIESILTIKSLTESTLIKTAGFEESGVTGSINVIDENKKIEVEHALKTGAGFGGCNTAVVFSKL